jgi:uncharacterized protein (TIGR02246 family)
MTSTPVPAPSPEDVAAVQQVPARIVAAWADNDADAFADVFAVDGSLILPNDVYLKSREEVRLFMKQAFAGPYAGTRVYGQPLAAKFLADGVALVITQGGVLQPGEEEVAPERAIRASWLLVKQDEEWLLTAYQNTPVQAG